MEMMRLLRTSLLVIEQLFNWQVKHRPVEAAYEEQIFSVVPFFCIFLLIRQSVTDRPLFMHLFRAGKGDGMEGGRVRAVDLGCNYSRKILYPLCLFSVWWLNENGCLPVEDSVPVCVMVKDTDAKRTNSRPGARFKPR
jgi:hypothetical protein